MLAGIFVAGDKKQSGLPCVVARKAILALSGEGRLRLGIAGASSALRSACTALDAGAPCAKIRY